MKTSRLSVLLLFLLFVSMPLVYASPIACMHIYHYNQQATATLNLTWFECGLLYKYGIDNFIAVLDEFGFNGVSIQPFVLDENGCQTIVHEDLVSLCDALDLYAETHAPFHTFLFVGNHGYLDKGLVNTFASRNYVLCIDDGVRNYTVLHDHLSYLKSYGVETCLVHFEDVLYKKLIDEGLVDYSMPCFYPSHPSVSYSKLVSNFRMIEQWCRGKTKFVPAIQAFGTNNYDWIYPNTTLIEKSLRFLQELNPYAIKWFEPWSGLSLRGEDFEGFLDHPEVWSVIRHACMHQGASSSVGISILLILFGIPLLFVLIIPVFLFLKLKEMKAKIELPASPEKQIDEKHKACMDCGKKFLRIRTFCPYCLTYHGQDGVKKA